MSYNFRNFRKYFYSKITMYTVSELLHKKLNAQKESLKNNFRGSHKLPQAHEKVCDENESRIIRR